MSTAKSPSKAARLGTRMRGAMADAYDKRGHMKASLGLVYSPKAKKDVVINSTLEFGHLLLVESDPDIEQVDYAPQKRVADLYGVPIGTILDAELVRRNRTVVWREVKPSEVVAKADDELAPPQLIAQAKAAGILNVEYERLTEKEIFSNPTRIHNWAQILPWISQCRHIPLEQYKKEVLQQLKKGKDWTFQELKEHAGAEKYGVKAAALFSLVQFGFVESDLYTAPFTLKSRFFIGGQ